MKTNLDRTINNMEEAKSFLRDLNKNGEEYHPEDDAHTIEWNGIEEAERPTQAQCEQLNKLMSDCFMEGFDPCEYLMELDLEYSLEISGSGNKEDLLKSLRNIMKIIEDEEEGEHEDPYLFTTFENLWK